MDTEDFLLHDTVCANCKRDEVDAFVTDPEFSLKVAPCGHKLCGQCEVRLLGGRQNTVACPNERCDKFIARTALSVKSLDEQEFERDISIRKNLNSIFTKTLLDFGGDIAEYNTYLETKEQYIYNLVTGTDEVGTRAAIKAYERENKDTIRIQLGKNAEKERKLVESLELKQQEKLKRLDTQAQDDVHEKRQRMRSKQEALGGVLSGTALVMPRDLLGGVPLPHPLSAEHQPKFRRDADLSSRERRKRRQAGGLLDRAVYDLEIQTAMSSLRLCPRPGALIHHSIL